jgi:hypothetical protein
LEKIIVLLVKLALHLVDQNQNKIPPTAFCMCAKTNIVEILSVIRKAQHSGRQTHLFHYALIFVLLIKNARRSVAPPKPSVPATEIGFGVVFVVT